MAQPRMSHGRKPCQKQEISTHTTSAGNSSRTRTSDGGSSPALKKRQLNPDAGNCVGASGGGGRLSRKSASRLAHVLGSAAGLAGGLLPSGDVLGTSAIALPSYKRPYK